MNHEAAFKRIAAITAIASAPVALASWILASLAVEGNFDLMSSPADIIALGSRAAELFRWAWLVSDTLGYALLLAPAALYLWHWLKPGNPNLVHLYTVFGLAYILSGAMALSLLGGAAPPMMRAYAQASGPERDMLMLSFQTVINVVFYGIGVLNYMLLGVWWLGIGAVLRNERRILGTATMILGIMALGWVVVLILRVESTEPLFTLEALILLLCPIWAAWLGIVILRSGN